MHRNIRVDQNLTQVTVLIRRHVVCRRTAASSHEPTRPGTDKRPLRAGIQCTGPLDGKAIFQAEFARGAINHLKITGGRDGDLSTAIQSLLTLPLR